MMRPTARKNEMGRWVAVAIDTDGTTHLCSRRPFSLRATALRIADEWCKLEDRCRILAQVAIYCAQERAKNQGAKP